MSKRKAGDAPLPVGECVTKVCISSTHLLRGVFICIDVSSSFSAAGRFKGADLPPGAPRQAAGRGGPAQVGAGG